MESVFYNISQVLGITIIHSLWQGLLVWFALRLVFTCAPSLSTIKKHNLAITAMLAISAWFVYTFISQLQAHTWVNFSAANAPAFVPHFKLPLNTPVHAISPAYYNYVIESYLPYVSAVYFIGLVFNLLRMGINWQRIVHIKRTMMPSDRMQDYVDNLCQQLNISKYVSVNISRYVDGPCMIGFFSPIILLPISLTTYLSAEEIKSILLHELSHIKRNDYLLNLVQQFISILLFFNPFAQLINRIINQERENRCDDLVVQTTAQPLVYAHALLKLEQKRQVDFKLALAATGKKYHLLTRIERIMKTQKPIANMRHFLVAVAIMAASISSIAWLNPTIANGKISIKKVKITYPIDLKTLFNDTTKKTAEKKASLKKASKNTATTKPIVVTPYGFVNDTQLEKLTAEVEKYSESVSAYYNSPDFKKQMEIIEQKSKAIEDYYNRPDIRKLHDEQEQFNKDFAGNSVEMEQLNQQIEQSSKKISAYYESPAFMAIVTRLEKKYNIPHKRYYSSRDTADWTEDYEKFQQEISKSIPSDVVRQKEITAQLGKKMAELYNTPEFIERNEKIQILSDSIKSVYADPRIKQQQIDMGLISAKVNAYQNSAQAKQNQKLLQEASARLTKYTNSPEFKKRMVEYKKAIEAALKDKNYQDNTPAKF